MNIQKQKIELNLDNEQFERIRTISKIFGIKTEQFIIKVIDSELEWIKNNFESNLDDLYKIYFDKSNIQNNLKILFNH